MKKEEVKRKGMMFCLLFFVFSLIILSSYYPERVHVVLTRVLSATVFMLIMLPCIYFSNTPLFVALIAFLSISSVYEMLKCNGLHKNIALSIPMYLIAGLPISAKYLDTEIFYKSTFLAVTICSFVVLAVYTFLKDKPDLGKVISSWFFSLYAVVGLTSLVLISNANDGAWHIMFFAFIAAWVTDSCALIFGKLFGKHKLLPSVSPKKTIEGAIGGMISCVAAFLLYAALLSRFFEYEFSSCLLIAACGLVCALAAIIGDLLFSAVKRSSGIKDFGRLMPGHGGILDRFDSIISIAQVLLWLVLAGGLG